jgi:hypothetical protein
MALDRQLQRPAGRTAGRHGHLIFGLAVSVCWARWHWVFWSCNCFTLRMTITPNWRRWWSAISCRCGSQWSRHRHRPKPFRRAIWLRCCKRPPTGLERVAATTEYLANRGEGVTRVAEQVANLGERIESLRVTLQNIENDRTADLRHELRTIARLLGTRTKPSGRWGAMPRRRDRSANSISGRPLPMPWAGW